jgi:hypothetical protein
LDVSLSKFHLSICLIPLIVDNIRCPPKTFNVLNDFSYDSVYVTLLVNRSIVFVRYEPVQKQMIEQIFFRPCTLIDSKVKVIRE